MKIVRTTTDPFYVMKTQLDGSQFQFSFQWNHQESAWRFDLIDANGNPVAQGVKIVPNTPLLGRCHYLDNCPPGDLICTSLDPVNDAPPGLLDLDLTAGTEGRCRLYYIPFLDWLALATSTVVTADTFGDSG